MALELVKHGFHQMLLRRKWGLQESSVNPWPNVQGAFPHEWVPPTLAECASYAVQLGFGL